MIQKFFFILINIWLPNPHRQAICRQAIDFYYFAYQLKLAAFLSSHTTIGKKHRLKMVKSVVKKMPALSEQFFWQLNKIEDDFKVGKVTTTTDLHFVVIKSQNLLPFISFLKNIDNDNDIEKLKLLLLEMKSTRNAFKIKRQNRNNRR